MASRQHGVVSRPQLLALGFTDGAIQSDIERRLLHRIHVGVYGVGYKPATEEGRWMAAVLASGPNALLSHLDAARLWRIYDAAGPRVHVLSRSNRRDSAILVHRTRRLDPGDVATCRGIPVTSVPRTLVDLSQLLGRDRILRAMREAEFRGVLDHDALNAAVQRARGRRNIAVLRTALARHRPGQIVRDELEHRFLELLDRAGVRPPRTNVKVATKSRAYVVDCLWRSEGVAVELDGRAAHIRTESFERDRARDAALSAAGLLPVRFTWKRVTTEGDDVVAELVAMLARRGGA